MSAAEFPVVTISGSMRFYDRMQFAAALFTRKGWIVLMPHKFDFMGMENTADAEFNLMLEKMHFTKISMSGLVFVVNVNGYIGNSTWNEIDYARVQTVDVAYWHPEYPYVNGNEYQRSMQIAEEISV